MDDADYRRVRRHRWWRAGPGYAATQVRDPVTGRWITLYLHRFLLGAPAGRWVHHRNRDRLDNRRANLRAVSPAENAAARVKRRSASSSRFKGVSRTRGGRWRVAITAAGRRHSAGTYACELEAARAYDRLARELFGEFAGLNFPDDRE